MDNGVPKGFLLKRTQDVFTAAGVETHFVSEPLKRIWANFQHGATNYCAISWYKLPEREAVAQFTLPIHIDPPHVVLIAPDAVAQVKAHTTLASLLDDSALTLALVDGVSYGPELDAQIKRGKNQIMRRTVEPTLMMRMLSVGRASFMFVDREDWEYFRKKEKWARTPVRYELPDMPPGLKRHIVCSKHVAPEVMERLNQAITASGGATATPAPADNGKAVKLK